MIKTEIHTLEGQFDIEIKKNENFYVLLVIASKSRHFKDHNSKVWSGKILETKKLFEITNLIKECSETRLFTQELPFLTEDQ